ncbi:hypothetical protein Plhal304r1_c051g0133831 [Plasmopara halstedii]
MRTILRRLMNDTKIRSTTSAIRTCGALRDFYNRKTLYNCVTMTCRLRNFKVENGIGLEGFWALLTSWIWNIDNERAAAGLP